MPHVKNLIKQHNLKILKKHKDKIQRPCNCRIKESCPLNSKCVYQCMVCKAEVSANTSYKEYYGASKRGSNLDTLIIHNLSETYFINVIELSKYLWTLEANRTEYHLKWSTKLYASWYKCGTRRFDLFLTEKWLLL